MRNATRSTPLQSDGFVPDYLVCSEQLPNYGLDPQISSHKHCGFLSDLAIQSAGRYSCKIPAKLGDA